MNNSIESYLHESGKLNGTNFFNWKFKMQTLLESANAWLIILGNEERTGTPAQEQYWDKREINAKFILKMSIKDNIIPHIRDCKSAADIWTTIKNLYETQNTNRVLALKGKLFALKMDENEFVAGFMARVKDLRDKLGAIGEKVSDLDLVTLTLNRMTDEYQTFISGLSAREKAPLFDDLTVILLQEEERRQNLKTQSNDLALMAKMRQYRGKQHQHQHQHQQPQQQGANSFQKRPFRVDCALSASKGDEDNIWYVDHGTSSHMTGKKDCFEFLEESACGSKIYLGDDSGYEIKCCGDIPVKLPSGDIKHLKNVLYVPGIKKNLISVSMITDQDMQVQFFKNGCVIQDSQLETVATGVRVGNLYRLDARSMPRQAMVAATSTVKNLWHQRFGHLNLQDLILLQKKGMVDGLPALHNIKLECDGCALGKMHRD
eukprot:PITA_28028